MRSIRLRGLGLLLAGLLLPATLVGAPTPGPDAQGERGSLAGQLLIAAPEMGDPRFDHAVILLLRHNRDGAFGIMINRPVDERSLASLLSAPGQTDATLEGSVKIFSGGPVEPAIGFVLHSAEYHRPETLAIDGRVAMTASPEVLRDIGHHRGPGQSLVAFGYAGWGPGQLEAELARHDWFTAPETPALVFDEPRDQLWAHAMAQRTRDL